MGTETKPRQVAQIMLRDFIEGGQIQVDPDAYPKEIKYIAIKHARNTAALVVHHARKARNDPRYKAMLQRQANSKEKTPGQALAGMALRYEEVRGR